MKKKHIAIIMCLTTILLAACASSQQSIQTAIAQTWISWTAAPTSTPANTPTPLSTNTSTPSPYLSPKTFDDLYSLSAFNNSNVGGVVTGKSASGYTSLLLNGPRIIFTSAVFTLDIVHETDYSAQYTAEFIMAVVGETNYKDALSWVSNELRMGIAFTLNHSAYDSQQVFGNVLLELHFVPGIVKVTASPAQ